MDPLTPEAIQTLLQIGGTPAVLAVVFYKVWNGTSVRMKSIEEKLDTVLISHGERITKLELKGQLQDEIERRFKEV